MQSVRNIFGQAGRVAGKRQVRFGANATVMTIAFIAILVFINILATRNHTRWDLTAEKTFSLSPETIKIIQALDQPVEITGFFGRENRSGQDELASRLKEYTSRSNLITYRFIDPDVEPLVARRYEITSYGTIVFESGDRRQQTTATDEQALTGALVKVTQEAVPTIYFLTGHEERSLSGFEQFDYSEAKQVIEDDNFQVGTISLIVSNTIPLENSVLIIADPKRELQEREEELIQDYLAQGGRAMILSDPLNPPVLANVLEAAGLSWENDLLIDQQSLMGNPVAPAVIEYPFSPITQDVRDATVFPTVRTLAEGQVPTGVTLTPLLKSSSNSQAATNFRNEQVQLSPDDAQGPLTFGYSIEGTIPATEATTSTTATNAQARLVVLGDADFASNAYLNLPGSANRDFFRSAVAWLATQENEFTLPPRPQPVDRSVFLTEQQGTLIFYGSTLGLPLLVIIAGIGVWWQRR